MKKRKSVEQVAWNVCVEGTFYLDYNIFRVIFSYIFGPLKDIVPGRKQVNLIVLVEKCSLLQVSDDISFFFFKDVMDDIRSEPMFNFLYFLKMNNNTKLHCKYNNNE